MRMAVEDMLYRMQALMIDSLLTLHYLFIKNNKMSGEIQIFTSKSLLLASIVIYPKELSTFRTC
jgi:hypothetical protein